MFCRHNFVHLLGMWTEFFAVIIEMNLFGSLGKQTFVLAHRRWGKFRERSPAAKSEEKRLLSQATFLAEFLHHVIYLLGFYKKIFGVIEGFFIMATMRL